MTAPTRAYEVRDATGLLIAIHERYETAHGKRFVWRWPDGAAAAGDLRLDEMPLYGIERLGKFPALFIVEGEKACEALWAVGLPAVATVCGAASTPSRAALAELTGRDPVLWPDNDSIGYAHMARVGRRLAPIVGRIREYVDQDAGKGHDAADALGQRPSAYEVEALWRVLYP